LAECAHEAAGFSAETRHLLKIGVCYKRQAACIQYLTNGENLAPILGGMTFRIEKRNEGDGTVFGVSGRIAAENLEELRTEIAGDKHVALIDLEHVTLVDVEGVRFLGACETEGIALVHCSPYIREWIERERKS
jgi:hypothetical protein